MRSARNILACLIIAAFLAGCAFDTGNDSQRSYRGGFGHSDGYGPNGGYAPSGGYGFNGGYAPSGGYVDGDGDGYDSGNFGSGYSYSGGIAGFRHYYGY